jgi:adenylate cyclase
MESVAPGPALATAPRCDYRLAGTVENGDRFASAWFTLTDVADGNVVWSRNFERMTPAGSQGAGEDAIVVALTNSLLQSYGVIRSRDRAKHLASTAGDPRYRCILEAADAIRTADRRTHDQARACLEQLTALDPSFAVGFTFLSLIYNREFQLGYELRPGDSPPLDRALRAVRQSINLQPESSRGYLALMVILFNRREIPVAVAAGEKTLAKNKYDMLALGEFGGRLIVAGEIERGMKMLRDAGANDAVRPAWHYIYLFIGNYVGGDMDKAAEYASQIPNDNTPLGQVARALAAKAADDPARVAEALDRLIAIDPRWGSDARGELARIIIDQGIVDRLTRDLAAIGLSTRDQAH